MTAGHYAKPEAITSARTHRIENLVKDTKYKSMPSLSSWRDMGVKSRSLPTRHTASE